MGWKHRLSEVDLEKRIAVCSHCGPVSIKLRSGQSPRCRIAHLEKERRRDQKRAADREHEVRGWFNELKSGPCADCGRTFPPYVMDFDHLDPVQKLKEVSKLVRARGSRKKIL